MKNLLRFSSAIEPLEARIAPALLVNGANLLGSGSPSIGETSIGGDQVTLVKVLSGQALVWYFDGTITSISVADNTSLEITGDIGAIVGNLAKGGRLSDSDNDPSNGEDGAVLLPNRITGLKTFPLGPEEGDISWIITGGSVANVSINGELDGLYAGDGVFHTRSVIGSSGTVFVPVGFDFNPVELGVQSDFALTLAGSPDLLPGASIKGITIQTAHEMQIISGSGDPHRADATGAGAAGGSIESIRINSALVDALSPGSTPSYEILAGGGQAGKTGGAGGSVLNVIEKGSSGLVKIEAGQGGRGNAGTGGGGGSVRGLDMQSDGTNYQVVAGDGGEGLGGGAGGSTVNNSFANRTPNSSVLISVDFTGDGLDDVLVVDSGSGKMVLSRNVGDGSDFQKVIQYFDDDGNPIIAIGSLGTTPVDGYATDWDADGDQDIVIAYKNSSNIGIFFNDSHGSFYTIEDDAYVVDGFQVDIGATPTFIAPGSFGPSSSSIIILATDAGQSSAFFAYSSDEREVTLFGTPTELKRLATDVVTTSSSDDGGHVFVGMQDGRILELKKLGDDEGPAFEVVSTGESILGGVANLDVSSDGLQLLALSGAGRSLGLFDVGDGGLLAPITAPVFSPTGRGLVAHFVDTGSPTTDDSIALLSALAAGSRFDVFAPGVDDGDPLTDDSAYTLTQTFSPPPTLKNFAVVDGGAQPGYAAVAGSLNQFYHSASLTDLNDYSLPFEGKKVSISAGDGGDAYDLGKVLGKGGTGGNVTGLNAEANEIRVNSGHGGDSSSGAAGSAGSVSNPALLLTTSGISLAPALLADEILQITLGNGGTPTGPGSKSASGGNGGSLTGVKLQLASGEVKLFSGDGGDANGGIGGQGGDIAGVTVTSLDGSLTVQTGTGGDAPTGKMKAGHGGSVTGLRFSLELDADAEKLEKAYFVSLLTGAGGNATEGQAGSGGSVTGTSLILDGADRTYDDSTKTPPLVDSHRDSTVSISLRTGAGGDGALGGHGGAISGFTSASVFDQKTERGIVLLNYVVISVVSGLGGDGTAGPGGDGGSIGFGTGGVAGITFFDPDAVAPLDNPDRLALRVTAGAGGQGSTKGGAGGGIVNLLAKNSPFISGGPISYTQLESAVIRAGSGGDGLTLDGGKGGDLTNVTLGVADGVAHFFTGDGGDGGASGKGGNGGTLSRSDLGAVNVGIVFDDSDPAPAQWPNAALSYNVGLALVAGDGGAGGKAGGIGGGMKDLQLNTPQLDAGYSAVIFAGDGGAGLGAAPGGAGGAIAGINQSKDVNSAINIIQAGTGGASAGGKGGIGGAVTGVKTVGFIGRPTFSDGFSQGQLGVFDENGLAQGLFSGRGGDGVTDGIAGAITGIAARQIAAIAASYDSATQTFGIASKVSQVTASLIGYEVVRNNIFADTNGGSASPSGTRPVDGFILAAAITKVNTTRPGFSFLA